MKILYNGEVEKKGEKTEDREVVTAHTLATRLKDDELFEGYETEVRRSIEGNISRLLLNLSNEHFIAKCTLLFESYSTSFILNRFTCIHSCFPGNRTGASHLDVS